MSVCKICEFNQIKRTSGSIMRSFCVSCRWSLIKLKENRTKWTIKDTPASNLVCKNCFSPPECIDVSGIPFLHYCEDCSKSCAEIISIDWNELLMDCGNPLECEERKKALEKYELYIEYVKTQFEESRKSLESLSYKLDMSIDEAFEEKFSLLNKHQGDFIRIINKILLEQDENLKTLFIENIGNRHASLVNEHYGDLDDIKRTFEQSLVIEYNLESVVTKEVLFTNN